MNRLALNEVVAECVRECVCVCVCVLVCVCVWRGGGGEGGGGGKGWGEGRIFEDSNCAMKKIDTQQVR